MIFVLLAGGIIGVVLVVHAGIGFDLDGFRPEEGPPDPDYSI